MKVELEQREIDLILTGLSALWDNANTNILQAEPRWTSDIELRNYKILEKRSGELMRKIREIEP